MGQYYKPISIDKKEFLSSHRLGSGLKLMEHSWLKNQFVGTVMYMLSASWSKTRFVWAGDYSDGLQTAEGKEGENSLYSLCGDGDNYEEVKTYSSSDNWSNENLKDNFPDFSKLRYIVNHDKNQFVDISKAPDLGGDMDGWQIHPLPLLTCIGNGRGGGDYRGENEHLGTWAYDLISASETIPKGMTELVPSFTE